MRPASIFAGLIGGLLAALLLIPSLYLDVPRSYISDWSTMPRALGPTCTILSAAVLVLTGMLGAASWPERQARGGALAGMVAGMVCLVVVLPGLGVMAHGDLISVVEGGRVTSMELKRSVVSSVVLTPWYQTLGSGVTMLSGVLLGWLGGVIHDLWRGQPTRTPPTVRPSPVAWVGIATMPVVVPVLLGVIVGTESMVFTDFGATPTWLGQAQLTSPMGLGFMMAGVCLFLVAHDAVLVGRSGHRGRAAIWLLGASIAVMLPLVSVPIYWRVLILPGGIVGILSSGVLMLAGLIAGALSDKDLEGQPRLFQDVIGEATLSGVIVTVMFALHGLSSSAVVALISGPFRALIIDGATRVETQSLSDAVQSVYASHLVLPVIAGAVAMAYLAFGLPVWLVSRWLNR